MRNLIGGTLVAAVVAGVAGFWILGARLADLESQVTILKSKNPNQTEISVEANAAGTCVAKIRDNRVGNKVNKNITWSIVNPPLDKCRPQEGWRVELEFTNADYPLTDKVLRSYDDGPFHVARGWIRKDAVEKCYSYDIYLVEGATRTKLMDPELEVEPPQTIAMTRVTCP